MSEITAIGPAVVTAISLDQGLFRLSLTTECDLASYH